MECFLTPLLFKTWGASFLDLSRFATRDGYGCPFPPSLPPFSLFFFPVPEASSLSSSSSSYLGKGGRVGSRRENGGERRREREAYFFFTASLFPFPLFRLPPYQRCRRRFQQRPVTARRGKEEDGREEPCRVGERDGGWRRKGKEKEEEEEASVGRLVGAEEGGGGRGRKNIIFSPLFHSFLAPLAATA